MLQLRQLRPHSKWPFVLRIVSFICGLLCVNAWFRIGFEQFCQGDHWNLVGGHSEAVGHLGRMAIFTAVTSASSGAWEFLSFPGS